MALRNMHIRMSEEEYDFIRALAEGLNCSQAEIIRKAIFHSDMKAIVEAYRKRQGDLYLQRYVECGMDEDTKNQLEILGQELNQSTQQIRRIGTNISTMVRDIRNGKVKFASSQLRQQIGTELVTIMEANEKAMEKQGVLAEKMAGVIGNVKLKVKTKEAL